VSQEGQRCSSNAWQLEPGVRLMALCSLLREPRLYRVTDAFFFRIIERDSGSMRALMCSGAYWTPLFRSRLRLLIDRPPA
jgi:hypothetical protein